MKKNKIYITTMYRWGDTEKHSYVLFAGFSKHKAITCGNTEKIDRGYKYMPQVLEFDPDSFNHKIIHTVEMSPSLK